MVREFIFIPHNVPSLKNSKVKTQRGIFASTTVKKYLSLLGIQSYSVRRKEVVGYKNRPNQFEQFREQFERALAGKKEPFDVGFHFVRDSKRDFDFNNATQIIADLLVAHGMIEDDCMRYFLPYPLKINGQAYSVDKEHPGVYIYIGEMKLNSG